MLPAVCLKAYPDTNPQFSALFPMPDRNNLRQSGVWPHPCNVRYFGPVSLLRPARRRAPSILRCMNLSRVQFVGLLVLVSLAGPGQAPVAPAQTPALAQGTPKDGPAST